MNELPKKEHRGRPRKARDDDIDLHVVVNRELFERVHRPNCSITSTIERGLRAATQYCQSQDLQNIGFLIREEKRQIAFHTQNLSRLREQAKRLGIVDIDQFEDSLNGW